MTLFTSIERFLVTQTIHAEQCSKTFQLSDCVFVWYGYLLQKL